MTRPCWIRREVPATLLDNELTKAAQLAKDKQYCAAGVVAGIVLEKHHEQLCDRRSFKIGGRTIADLNELLKRNEVIDFWFTAISVC